MLRYSTVTIRLCHRRVPPLIGNGSNMSLKIATWNMNRWQQSEAERLGAWSYLTETVQPDIALLQETVPPPGQENVVYCMGGIGMRRPWGSAVVGYGRSVTELTTVKSPYADRDVSLLQTHPGCVAIAQTPLPDGSLLTVISVYGLIDAGYAQTTVLRILADLTPIFDTGLFREHMVLGGDLNIGKMGRPTDKHVQRYKLMFEYFETFGFVDCLDWMFGAARHLPHCPCGQALCRHTRTQRRRQSPDVPYNNDYILASRGMAERLTSCHALDQDDAWALSDHCPVVADFDI